MGQHTDSLRRWDDARISATTEHADVLRSVIAAMEVEHPHGSEVIRDFLATEFVAYWVMFGHVLPCA